MLETAPIDYTMEGLRNFKRKLDHFHDHGGSREDLKNQAAKIQHDQQHWRQGYNLAESEWAEISTEDFPVVLDVCTASEQELSGYIAQLEQHQLSEFAEPFVSGRHIIQKCAAQMETMLRRRGRKTGPKVNRAEQLATQAFAPHLTKHQAKINLIQKFDDLKRSTPENLHEDLDRACRQALEQLDRQ